MAEHDDRCSAAICAKTGRQGHKAGQAMQLTCALINSSSKRRWAISSTERACRVPSSIRPALGLQMHTCVFSCTSYRHAGKHAHLTNYTCICTAFISQAMGRHPRGCNVGLLVSTDLLDVDLRTLRLASCTYPDFASARESYT